MWQKFSGILQHPRWINSDQKKSTYVHIKKIYSSEFSTRLTLLGDALLFYTLNFFGAAQFLILSALLSLNQEHPL